MKARLKGMWKMLLVLPLIGAYGVQGCTAKAMRTAADALSEQADEMDGDQSADLGDWLADQVEDW
jgi:hypothetical protein